MSLEAIDRLVLRHYGLATTVMGPRALSRAVRRRLDALGLAADALDVYAELVRTSSPERQELLELLVVPETWFFRNEKVYPYMVRWAQQEWRLRHPTLPLRVLSLACATGEEPYSIVMAMRDGGVPFSQFSVEAVDISERALANAQNAVYGRNSFRSFAGRDVTPIAHHLVDVGQGLYQVKDDIRNAVTFLQGNLNDPSMRASLGHSRYDIVLCRNVMIYFPREGQKRLLSGLFDLLADDGRLFVGHSELIQFVETRFVSTSVPMTFSFRKRVAGDRQAPDMAGLPTGEITGARPDTFDLEGVLAMSPHTQPAPGATWNAGSSPGGVTPASTTTASPAAPSTFRPLPPLATTTPDPPMPVAPAPRTLPPPPQPEPVPESPAVTCADLSQARRAADAGRLEEARTLTRAWLDGNRPTAEALCLMGVISDAAGDAEAAEHHLRRAIYLDPRHYEALVHLALLLERNGDPAASTFHRRALRVAQT